MTARVKIPEGERRAASCVECMSTVTATRTAGKWVLDPHVDPDRVVCHGKFTRLAGISKGGLKKKQV